MVEKLQKITLFFSWWQLGRWSLPARGAFGAPEKRNLEQGRWLDQMLQPCCPHIYWNTGCFHNVAWMKWSCFPKICCLEHQNIAIMLETYVVAILPGIKVVSIVPSWLEISWLLFQLLRYCSVVWNLITNLSRSIDWCSIDTDFMAEIHENNLGVNVKLSKFKQVPLIIGTNKNEGLLIKVNNTSVFFLFVDKGLIKLNLCLQFYKSLHLIVFIKWYVVWYLKTGFVNLEV